MAEKATHDLANTDAACKCMDLTRSNHQAHVNVLYTARALAEGRLSQPCATGRLGTGRTRAARRLQCTL